MVFFFVQHIYFLGPQLHEARWLNLYVHPHWTHKINYNLRQIRTYLVNGEAAQHFSEGVVRGSARHVRKYRVVKATITSCQTTRLKTISSPTATDDVKYKNTFYTSILSRNCHTSINIDTVKTYVFLVNPTPVLYGSRRSKDFPGLKKQQTQHNICTTVIN